MSNPKMVITQLVLLLCMLLAMIITKPTDTNQITTTNHYVSCFLICIGFMFSTIVDDRFNSEDWKSLREITDVYTNFFYSFFYRPQ